MKRFAVPATLAAGVLAFSLAGCAGGPAKSVDKDALTGFWVLEESSQVGFDAVLDLDEEFYAELLIDDMPIDGTWSTDGTTAKIEFGGDSPFDELDFEDAGELGVIVDDEGADDESDAAESGTAVESGEAAASDASASAAAADASTAAADASAEAADAEADGDLIDVEADDEEEEVKVASIYVSDGKLVLGSEEGSKLVFVKGNAEEYYGDDYDFDDMEVVDEVSQDITPVTVTDDDTCTITVTGKGTDSYSYPFYRLSIANKTDKGLELEASDDFKVNGQEAYAELGVIVDPDETVEVPLYFDKDEIGTTVDALKNAAGTIVVYEYDEESDEESDDPVATYTFKVA